MSSIRILAAQVPRSPRSVTRRAIYVALGFVFLCLSQPGRAQTAQTPALRITTPIDETSLTRLVGNTHPLARPEFEQGIAPLNLPMERMLLVLRRSPEQEAALQALLDQQHDKSSPNYHRWLTPDQFGQQFGPADQDIQAITSWLASHGFQVTRVGRGRTAIEFSGTAAQVRDAFHTEIHSYLAGGAQHWANATDPQIPSALGPVVSGVAALNNFPVKPLHHLAGAFSKATATGDVKPLASVPNSLQVAPQFTFSAPQCGPLPCYAVGPYDFATIYNVLPLWNMGIDGTNQSIAIVGESNINLQDVQDFRSMFGLSTSNLPAVIVDGPDPGVTHDDAETEALLDVEWAGAVAPGAKIKFITSASTDTAAGVDLSALYAVDNNVAPVLSVSFGLCELFLGATGNQFHGALWEQAAAQGITVLVASGDNGSAGCDDFNHPAPAPAQGGLAVSGLASTPFNVAVGGTDFMNFGRNFATVPSPYWNTTNNAPGSASAKGYIPESTWDESCTNDGLALLGLGSTAEARCNNPQLAPLVETVGGSGGMSNCTTSNGLNTSSCGGGYLQPAWQTGIGPARGRELPDVSLFASSGFWGSFYIMCEADALPLNPSCSLQNGFTNFLGVGGTSASTPAFAGIMALINQYTGSPTGQGNANYELYKLASFQNPGNCNSTTGPASGCIFNDVTFGTIAMPCASGSTTDCTVSLGGDSYGVLSGYDAGAGYDRATGLGSVNAFNLAQNWSKASSSSTTTTLSLNNGAPVNITHGQSVPVSITVKSNAGTPTGDVSLIATSLSGPVMGAGVDTQTLSGGIANWQTNRLPGSGGSSYSVHAHYSGDGTFGASDSGSIAVTVAPEASTTKLSGFLINSDALVPLPPSVAFGTPVYLRADVGSSAHPNADTAPSGTVTFTDPNSGSQAYSLNSEGAAIAGDGLCSLALGAHSFTASYSGDNSYQPSGPTSPVNFTITQATPLATLLPRQVNVAVNSTVLLTVIVGENNGINPLTGTYCSSVPPTGTVTLFDTTTQKQIASSPIPSGLISTTAIGQSVAVITVSASALSFGTNSVTAMYSGDSNYLTSTSSAITVNVGYPTTTVLTSSNLAVPVSTNVTFTAQVTTSQSGGPPITGNVTFQLDLSAGTTVPLVNGTAQFTMSFASAVPSSHKVLAQYSGDPNYLPSRAFLQEQVVIPDFTLNDTLGNGGNVVIAAPGDSSAPITLTISGINGYNGTIAFSPSSCVIAPAGSLSSCSFNPSSITASGNTQLVINTTAPRTAATPISLLGMDRRQLPPIAVCVLFLATLVMFKKQRRLSLAFGSVILLALFGLWACGSSGSGMSSTNTIPGTPTGVQYSVNITAAPAGATAHSINLTFVVQ